VKPCYVRDVMGDCAGRMTRFYVRGVDSIYVRRMCQAHVDLMMNISQNRPGWISMAVRARTKEEASRLLTVLDVTAS
jgi:hypothetical protein